MATKKTKTKTKFSAKDVMHAAIEPLLNDGFGGFDVDGHHDSDNTTTYALAELDLVDLNEGDDDNEYREIDTHRLFGDLFKQVVAVFNQGRRTKTHLHVGQGTPNLSVGSRVLHCRQRAGRWAFSIEFYLMKPEDRARFLKEAAAAKGKGKKSSGRKHGRQ